MRYISLQASCYTSNWSYWIEFYDANVAFYNMLLVLVILLIFAKSSENRLSFWRRFETDNEIFGQSRLEIQIPYEFFLQHSPDLTVKNSEISRTFVIWRRNSDFRDLKPRKKAQSRTEHFFKTIFRLIQTRIFRLKIVLEPDNAWQCYSLF